MNLEQIKSRWSAFAASPSGRIAGKTVRVLILVGVLAYLTWELTRVGWEAIYKALPTTPWFYLLFLLIYFLLPVAEVLIYRVTWAFDTLRSFPAFLKKRVYNKDVLGYSGEVYFFAWARKNIRQSDRALLKTIRDNNILSSVASTVVALGLLMVFLSLGKISLQDWVGERGPYYLYAALVGLAVLVPIGLRFRRYFFSMSLRPALLILSIQFVRLIAGQVLQIGQWAVVMPAVSLDVWFTFAAVSIILTRIPFLPNQQLIFLGAGVKMSGLLDVPTAEVAGMLLVVSVLDKVLNLGLLAFISVSERNERRRLGNTGRVPKDEALRNGEPAREERALPLKS